MLERKMRVQNFEMTTKRMNKVGRKIKCLHCHKEGHNKIGCQLKKWKQQVITKGNDAKPIARPNSNQLQGRVNYRS